MMKDKTLSEILHFFTSADADRSSSLLFTSRAPLQPDDVFRFGNQTGKKLLFFLNLDYFASVNCIIRQCPRRVGSEKRVKTRACQAAADEAKKV